MSTYRTTKDILPETRKVSLFVFKRSDAFDIFADTIFPANRLYIRISYKHTIWPLEIEISISIGIYKVSVSPKSVHEKLSTWVTVINNQQLFSLTSD